MRLSRKEKARVNDLSQAVLLAHAAATWFMVGLIWFVQIVHYPLMAAVSAPQFAAYEVSHQRRTTWVVAPVMIGEAGLAIMLCWSPPGRLGGSWVCWTGLALLALIWISTFAFQVPLHNRLSRGFADAPWRRLVATNWIRTVTWTARGVLAVLMLS
ncbi:MAG: hypothetical protein U0573_06590 [Phycisphaerales bacterium]|nr:hypothetical protein [Planctomycetota bacterium]